MHGISFSAYTRSKTSDELTREQIEHRMAILAPRFNWIAPFLPLKAMSTSHKAKARA